MPTTRGKSVEKVFTWVAFWVVIGYWVDSSLLSHYCDSNALGGETALRSRCSRFLMRRSVEPWWPGFESPQSWRCGAGDDAWQRIVLALPRLPS